MYRGILNKMELLASFVKVISIVKFSRVSHPFHHGPSKTSGIIIFSLLIQVASQSTSFAILNFHTSVRFQSPHMFLNVFKRQWLAISQLNLSFIPHFYRKLYFLCKDQTRDDLDALLRSNAQRLPTIFAAFIQST